MDNVQPDLSFVNIRPISTELSVVNEADVSCSFSMGNTVVIAALYGPMPPKYSRHEQFDRATVEVEINCVNKGSNNNGTNITAGSVESGQNHHFERDLAKHIRTLVESTLILAEYPRNLVVIRLNIIRNDGSVLAAALNACSLLLATSGLKVNSLPVSVSIAMFPTETEPTDEILVVDPTFDEESLATSVSTFTLQYTNAKSCGLLLSQVSGPVSMSKMGELLLLAERVGDIVHGHLKNAL